MLDERGVRRRELFESLSYISATANRISHLPRLPIDFYRWDNIATNTLLYPKLLHSPPRHSHSIVPGGFDVTSYTTRFTPFTSLMIRVATWPKNFMSNG